MRKIFIPILISVSAAAQTAYVPSIRVPIPAKIIPAQTVTIVVPAGGGKVTFTIPSQMLSAGTGVTPAVTAPVKLAPADVINLLFSCSGPDLQHLTCKAVKQP